VLDNLEIMIDGALLQAYPFYATDLSKVVEHLRLARNKVILALGSADLTASSRGESDRSDPFATYSADCRKIPVLHLQHGIRRVRKNFLTRHPPHTMYTINKIPFLTNVLLGSILHPHPSG
jgi:hypothetical protein